MSVYDINGNGLATLFGKDGNAINTAYDKSGNVVYNGQPVQPLPLNYESYTTTDLYTYVANGFNGFDTHGDVIAQLMANNKLYLFNLGNGSTIATAISITSSHGDSATFSDENYSEGDEFPLLYCTADTTPAVIYINRITRSSASLVKTLKFPQSAGYYGAGAFDFENDICYIVSYKENSYTSDNGGSNKTVVTKWDLSSLTDNGDGSYTPAYISSFECPFIYVMQGLQFFDGYIWISSGYNNGGNQYIYALNPTTHEIDYTITLDDHVEVEGLAWVYDETENKYWMLIGQQNGASGINYSRIEFETASD